MNFPILSTRGRASATVHWTAVFGCSTQLCHHSTLVFCSGRFLCHFERSEKFFLLLFQTHAQSRLPPLKVDRIAPTQYLPEAGGFMNSLLTLLLVLIVPVMAAAQTQDQLIAGAKSEGRLVLYASAATQQLQMYMGPNHWKQGFAENYTVLNTMCSYHYDQGLSERRLNPRSSLPTRRMRATGILTVDSLHRLY